MLITGGLPLQAAPVGVSAGFARLDPTEAALRRHVPVVINSFNQPTYLLRLAGSLIANGFGSLIVIDQGSTSRACADALALLRACPQCEVIVNAGNEGPHGFFHAPLFALLGDFFAYTDPDIELPDPLPADFLTRLRQLTETYRVGKAGCALRLSDQDLFGDATVTRGGVEVGVAAWEERFWQDEREPGVFAAEIDTTFAVYNKAFFSVFDFYGAVRVAGSFTARHRPWYADKRVGCEEWDTYARTASTSFWFGMRAVGPAAAPAAAVGPADAAELVRVDADTALQPPDSGGRFIGYVDFINPLGARGWCIDTLDTDSDVAVQLVQDGQVVGTAVANQRRPDVQDAGFPKLGCGFSLMFRTRNEAAGPETVQLRILGTYSSRPRAAVQAAGAPAAPTLARRLGFGDTDRLLIVNCDDLGSSHGANVATLRAMEAGMATSATLMVPCPWAAEGAAMLRGHAVGVHLTLTSEFPGYRWRGLTAGASLHDRAGFLHATTEQALEFIRRDEARAECLAQIERALAWGVDVTHLDAHMMVMQFRQDLFEIYLDLAAQFRVPVRMLAQDCPEQAGFAAATRAQTLGVLGNDHIVCPWPRRSGTVLAEAVPNLPPGVTEVFLHPVDDGDSLRSYDPAHAGIRAHDAECLVAPELRASIEAHGVHLISFREIRALQRGD